MAYRLVGSAQPPKEAIEALLGPISFEVNSLAKACGVEAVAIAVVKAWPNVSSGVLDWLRQAIDVEGNEVPGRIRHLKDGRALVGRVEAIEAVVGQVVTDVRSLPEEGPFWPAETI